MGVIFSQLGCDYDNVTGVPVERVIEEWIGDGDGVEVYAPATASATATATAPVPAAAVWFLCVQTLAVSPRASRRLRACH